MENNFDIDDDIQGGYMALEWSPTNDKLACIWMTEDWRGFLSHLKIEEPGKSSNKILRLSTMLNDQSIFYVLWTDEPNFLLVFSYGNLWKYKIEEDIFEVLMDLKGNIICFNPISNQRKFLLRREASKEEQFPSKFSFSVVNIKNVNNLQDFDTNTELGVIRPHMYNQGSWSDDEQFLALGTYNKNLGVWTTENYKLVFSQAFKSRINSVQWLKSKNILIVSEEQALWALNVETHQVLWSLPVPETSHVRTLYLNGTDYIVYRVHNSVTFMNAFNPTHKYKMMLELDTDIIAVSQDGKKLACARSFQSYADVVPPTIINIPPELFMFLAT